MTSRIYIVLMEDPITHTVEQPVCGDPTCICAQCEYDLLRAEAEAAQTAPPPFRDQTGAGFPR